MIVYEYNDSKIFLKIYKLSKIICIFVAIKNN